MINYDAVKKGTKDGNYNAGKDIERREESIEEKRKRKHRLYDLKHE